MKQPTPHVPGRPGRDTSVAPDDVFEKLTVLYRVSNTRNSHSRWVCRCVCGVEKEILATHLTQKSTTSCGCDRPKGPTHKQWKGHGEIHGDLFTAIRRGADGSKGRAPLPFEVTIEYLWELFLSQDRKCALSGVDIQFRTGNYNTKSRGRNSTASLDRVDSGLGYLPGNVQWVHKDINWMKNVFSQDRFIQWCHLVSKKHTL